MSNFKYKGRDVTVLSDNEKSHTVVIDTGFKVISVHGVELVTECLDCRCECSYWELDEDERCATCNEMRGW